jgi:hypothetical protein
VLTGDAAMRAFAGYERFPATLLADRMRLPAQLGTGAMARQLPRSASYHRLRRCPEQFVEEPSLRVLDRYFSWIAAFGRGSLARVLTPELTQDASASAFASYACEFERAGDVGLLQRLLSAESAHVPAGRSAREDGPDAHGQLPGGQVPVRGHGPAARALRGAGARSGGANPGRPSNAARPALLDRHLSSRVDPARGSEACSCFRCA